MHLVEVLEGCRQLLQHRPRITQVHAGHVVSFEGVHEALGHAVALRAGALLVFAHTSPFRPGPRFNKSSVIQLHPPTADTTQLVSAAAAGVQKIYESGYELAKAGVLLMDLCSGSSQQQSDLLFEAPRVQRDRTQLMKAMDRINARYGKATVHMPARAKRNQMMLLGA